MGVNDKILQVLEGTFSRYPIRSVLELGAQNFYQNYGPIPYGCYADQYYMAKGVQSYCCIDLNGENNAVPLDLSVAYRLPKSDMVTDFGTSEHIAAYVREDEDKATDIKNDTWKTSTVRISGIQALYNCWTTKYHASSLLIVSSNPATGHWPGHGHFYYTPEFYKVLSSLTNMKIVFLDEHYAMGNYVNGKEVCCVLDVRGSKWISFEEFKKAFQYIHPE